MGVRHSKPHTRRRHRKGRPTSERQSPEGGPCPAAAPPSPLDATRSCNEACPCNKARYDATEERERVLRNEDGINKTPTAAWKTAANQDDVTAEKEKVRCEAGLRVDLPELNESQSSRDRLPDERKPAIVERVSTTTNEKGETEWTISLDTRRSFDAQCRSRDEELLRIMASIRDALDSRIVQCSEGQNRLRVRLSVTPEPKSTHRLNPEDDDVTLPHHQPTSRSDDETKRRCRHERLSDVQVKSKHSDDKDRKNCSDRRQHYRQIPGVDKDETHPSTPASRSTRHRAADKANSRSRSRERHHVCSSKQHCCRGHRYQSPFDQSFQEAMYLRLRELQRDSAWEERLATRRLESSSSESSSDSEYSGDDGREEASREKCQVSRIFEPLSSTAMQAISQSTERRIEFGAEQTVSFHQRKSLTLSSGEVLKHSAEHDSAPKRKPWEDRGDEKTGARRKFTKTRKKSPGPAKPHHGYLRANVLPPGATSAFPNTPRIAPASPQGLVQRHQHEHIHHHYYYHNKPES